MSEVFLIQHGRIQDGCHHQVKSEWMSEGFFMQMVGTNLGKCEWLWEEKLRWQNPRWQNSRWQNSRWLPSSCLVRMNERSFLIQHGRIQDGCHHQFESEWMSESDWISLSQSFLQNCWFQDGRIQHGKIQDGYPSSSWVRMNEWRFFCANGGNQSWQVWVSLRGQSKMAESKMAKFKMAAIIKLSENEWVWVRLN